MAEPADVAVTVVYPASVTQQCVFDITLADGSTLRDAITACGILERCSDLDVATMTVGIYGQIAGMDQPLVAGDRVEIYRPLTMAPTAARRQRAKRGKGDPEVSK